MCLLISQLSFQIGAIFKTFSFHLFYSLQPYSQSLFRRPPPILFHHTLKYSKENNHLSTGEVYLTYLA